MCAWGRGWQTVTNALPSHLHTCLSPLLGIYGHNAISHCLLSLQRAQDKQWVGKRQVHLQGESRFQQGPWKGFAKEKLKTLTLSIERSEARCSRYSRYDRCPPLYSRRLSTTVQQAYIYHHTTVSVWYYTPRVYHHRTCTYLPPCNSYHHTASIYLPPYNRYISTTIHQVYIYPIQQVSTTKHHISGIYHHTCIYLPPYNRYHHTASIYLPPYNRYISIPYNRYLPPNTIYQVSITIHVSIYHHTIGTTIQPVSICHHTTGLYLPPYNRYISSPIQRVSTTKHHISGIYHHTSGIHHHTTGIYHQTKAFNTSLCEVGLGS